ncbi:MAG: amidase [Planctomycetota bacterium]
MTWKTDGLVHEPPELPFSIATARSQLRSGELSPVTLVELLLERICRLDPMLGAFTSVFEAEARQEAKRCRERLEAGDDALLLGIPIAIKDLIDVAGKATTCASRVRAGHLASQDAALITKLRAAGAILLGKTNLHEMAFGITTQVSCFGPARNPWQPDHITGGSSGGSAAALAAGLTLGAIGTDTGGSIRIPSSLCGTIGIKPTHGRVSCRGVWPLSWTLDHAGPMARTVEDAAWILEALDGFDAGDPMSRKLPPFRAAEALALPVRGLRVGIDRAWCDEQLTGPVRSVFELALSALESAGLTLVPIEIPERDVAQSISLTLLRGEAWAVHEELLASFEDAYLPETRLRLEECCHLTAADQARAMRYRLEYGRQAESLLESVDLLATPTTPCTAPVSSAEHVDLLGGQREAIRPLLTRFMRLFNLLGWPALSLPIGRDDLGLPIGLQFAAGPGDEARLVTAAAALETALGMPRMLASPTTELKPGQGREATNEP